MVQVHAADVRLPDRGKIGAAAVPAQQVLVIRVAGRQAVQDQVHAVRVDHRHQPDARRIPQFPRVAPGDLAAERVGFEVLLRKLHQQGGGDPLQRVVRRVVGDVPRARAQPQGVQALSQHARPDAGDAQERVPRLQALDVPHQHLVGIGGVGRDHVEGVRHRHARAHPQVVGVLGRVGRLYGRGVRAVFPRDAEERVAGPHGVDVVPQQELREHPPGLRAYHAVGLQPEAPLEFLDRPPRLPAEHAVHPAAVQAHLPQRRLHFHHVAAAVAHAQSPHCNPSKKRRPFPLHPVLIHYIGRISVLYAACGQSRWKRQLSVTKTKV